jgi:hypothetical protein
MHNVKALPESPVTILVVGGDSVEAFRRRAAGMRGHIQHWSGRKTRDLSKTIPQSTEAVIVVLDRVSHALAKKVRTEAARRGLPVYFRRRSRQINTGAQAGPEWLGPTGHREDA